MGVVISKTTQIGDDVMLHHHGVALGGTTWKKIKRNPTFGSNLVIGSRSTILDPLKILDNTKGRGRCCGCEWHTGRFDWYGRIGQSGFQGCREKVCSNGYRIHADPLQSRTLAKLIERAKQFGRGAGEEGMVLWFLILTRNT